MKHRIRRPGLRILITAGPTREYIDPIRFITNQSTGQIGYLMAARAACRGHSVILLSGPTGQPAPPGVRTYTFETVDELRDLACRFFPQVDAVIAAAAVGDFKPVACARTKIKKSANGELMMPLIRTPDVLALLGRKKKHQVLVGFSLETNNLARYARDKLRAKNLDFIVANQWHPRRQPFGKVTVSGMIIDREGSMLFQGVHKRRLSAIILDRVEKLCYILKKRKGGI